MLGRRRRRKLASHKPKLSQGAHVPRRGVGVWPPLGPADLRSPRLTRVTSSAQLDVYTWHTSIATRDLARLSELQRRVNKSKRTPQPAHSFVDTRRKRLSDLPHSNKAQGPSEANRRSPRSANGAAPVAPHSCGGWPMTSESELRCTVPRQPASIFLVYAAGSTVLRTVGPQPWWALVCSQFVGLSAHQSKMRSPTIVNAMPRRSQRVICKQASSVTTKRLSNFQSRLTLRRIFRIKPRVSAVGHPPHRGARHTRTLKLVNFDEPDQVYNR